MVRLGELFLLLRNFFCSLLFKIALYNGDIFISDSVTTVTSTGKFEKSFNFDNSTMDRIKFGLNGAQRDTLVKTNELNLETGTYYLSVNFTNITQGSISWKDMMISATQNDTFEPYVRTELQALHHLIHKL